LLIGEAVAGVLVLVAGVGWLLLRRRRLGRVAWLAAGGLGLFGVALTTGSLWTLLMLGMLETSLIVDWRTVDRWGDLVGAVTELALVGGVLAVAVSVFLGRPVGGDGR
jgi:hypothetical protein